MTIDRHLRWVLVVDDDPTILSSFLRVTKDLQVRLRCVSSAEEAMSLLKSNQVPTAIICDYRLPGIDGLSFLERVRLSHPKVRSILYTGESVLRTSVGVDIPVLGKPCSPEALRELIVELVAAPVA